MVNLRGWDNVGHPSIAGLPPIRHPLPRPNTSERPFVALGGSDSGHPRCPDRKGSEGSRRRAGQRARIRFGSAPVGEIRYNSGQLAATTSSLIVACTSGCSRTRASNEPTALIAPVSSILRRSSNGPPDALTASATSPWVTAPKRRPDLPALATTVTDLASS